MIPNLVDIGTSWNVLPIGIHTATLSEIEVAFAYNARRKFLFNGLCIALQNLTEANCKTIYIDGSFVTDKTNPGDFDVCWDPTDVNIELLDPVFLDFSDKRKNQKLKYGGEFFPSSGKADGTHPFVDFFQIDKETGLKKGIVCFQLQKSGGE